MQEEEKGKSLNDSSEDENQELEGSYEEGDSDEEILEEEESTDESSEDEEFNRRRLMMQQMKPKFIVSSKDKKEKRENEENEKKRKEDYNKYTDINSFDSQKLKNRDDALELLEDQLRHDQEFSNSKSENQTSILSGLVLGPEIVDDTDGLDPDNEYEEWKVRELARIDRDRKERQNAIRG